MSTLIVTPLAQEDILAAADWYQSQASGMVQPFLSQLRQLQDRIVSMPQIYQERMAYIRVARMQRFPYCLYFRVDADLIVVIALLHERRDPAVWQARL
ncbi:type II toxin-antitoxin system RelE/ParE family toxin [Niveispirillum sp. KHB5.9]|uniref:type II toxin-antitoxin system RelE/ParE family toxin n=1 Tax=Niveispirillum sp. KHB5.9 TaxID=3400269 RepID=UPI003A86FB37